MLVGQLIQSLYCYFFSRLPEPAHEKQRLGKAYEKIHLQVALTKALLKRRRKASAQAAPPLHLELLKTLVAQLKKT